MGNPFSHILEPENISDLPSDLDAYSYDSGNSELKPKLILWPTKTEHVARILRENNQARGQINIRGRGTSTTGSSFGRDSIILSSEKMNKIVFFDPINKTITVESGITVPEINLFLSESELNFSVSTLKETESIGGLFAINAYFRESETTGQFANLVQEFEFVDGTGKIFFPAKKEFFAGSEGITGFLTKVTLKLSSKFNNSIDIMHFDYLTDLLKKVNSLKKNVERIFVEFFDKKTSLELFGMEKYTLVIAYSTLKGKFNSIQDISDLMIKINSAHSKIRQRGYYHVIDCKTTIEKAYDLIDWCNSNNVPIHGHIGSGVFYAYFVKEEYEKIKTFKSFIKQISSKIGCTFGTGTDISAISIDEKKRLIRLKDELDYNNTLNKGTLLQYR